MEAIPFQPGVPHQELEVTLAGAPVVVEARWNTRDSAWYLNIFEVDQTPIVMGIKVVLGTRFGRAVLHPFFTNRALFAVDNSNTDVEAGLDDLGSRVDVVYLTEDDLQLANGPPFTIPPPFVP